jgi:hypothetical protein
VTVRGKESEIGDLSHFERGQIIGAHLAGAFVTKTATLLSVSKATASRLCWHTQISKEEQWAKINIDRRDCHTLRRPVSKTRRTTATPVTAELNIILKTLFPQKLSNVSFTKPTSMVGMQL